MPRDRTAKLQVVIHEDEHKLMKLLAGVYGVTMSDLGSSLVREWVIEQMQRDDTREALEIEGALTYADAMVARIEADIAEEEADREVVEVYTNNTRAENVRAEEGLVDVA